MDIILGSYADAHLADMDDTTLRLYDTLLSENDQDLYQWVTGQAPAPVALTGLVGAIIAHADGRRREPKKF